ncbi:MAG: ABC transporter substrate-binding protein [Bacteroidota bacterium]
MSKRIAAVLVALLAIGAVAGLTYYRPTHISAAPKYVPAPKTFNFGIPISMSGDQAITGARQREGFEMALEKINKEGGINGLPVRLIFEDDKGTSPGAIAAVTKMISEDKVIATFMTTRSVIAQALAPIILDNKVPGITGGSAWSLSELKNPWLFRVRTDDRTVGSIMAKFIVEDLKAKRIAAIHDTDTFGTGGFVETEKFLNKLGAKVLTEQKYTSGTKDYTAQWLAIKNVKPDVVFGWGTRLEDDAIILRQRGQLGVPGAFIGSASYASSDVKRIAGDNVEGIYSASGFTVKDSDPRVQGFVKAFNAKYHRDPDENSVWTYAGLLTLADAARRANVVKKEGGKLVMLPVEEARLAVRDALSNTKNFETPLATMTADKYGNLNHEMPIIQIVKGGEEKLVKVVKVTPEMN